MAGTTIDVGSAVGSSDGFVVVVAPRFIGVTAGEEYGGNAVSRPESADRPSSPSGSECAIPNRAGTDSAALRMVTPSHC